MQLRPNEQSTGPKLVKRNFLQVTVRQGDVLSPSMRGQLKLRKTVILTIILLTNAL